MGPWRYRAGLLRRGVTLCLLDVEGDYAGMAGDMGRRGGVAGGTCRSACGRMVAGRCISSCCMCSEGRSARFADADLAPRPGAGRFDRLPRAIVVRERVLEVVQDAFGTVCGPGGLRLVLLPGLPRHVCRLGPPSHVCRFGPPSRACRFGPPSHSCRRLSPGSRHHTAMQRSARCGWLRNSHPVAVTRTSSSRLSCP